MPRKLLWFVINIVGFLPAFFLIVIQLPYILFLEYWAFFTDSTKDVWADRDPVVVQWVEFCKRMSVDPKGIESPKVSP